MTNQSVPSFDLDDGMIESLRHEFGPDKLRAGLEAAVASGGPGARKAYFESFGKKWMQRAIELGEAHPDQTFECLKAAVTKTGQTFPYIPQRYLEIAYLGTQPIYTLPIVENWAQGITYKMPFCEYFKAVQESQGDAASNDLPCADACSAACKEAFSHFGFKVSVNWDAKMPADGYCQVKIRKAQA